MDPDQPYCGRCGERKATWGLVKRHLKEKHVEKLTCPLCHKYSTASSTKYRLRRHIEKFLPQSENINLHVLQTPKPPSKIHVYQLIRKQIIS